MKSIASRRRLVSRTGASSVEFALVFPIILTFFIGMIVLTQAFVLKDMTQHAAYEGTRQGIVLNATAEDAQAAAAEFMQMMGMRGVEVATEPAQFSNSTREVAITVSVPMNENAWIAAPFMPENWVISSRVEIAKRTD